MFEVIAAEYVDGYRISEWFNNGEGGVVDLADALWGPMFEPLKHLETFKSFRVSGALGTIAWGDQADLAPEALYDMLVEQTRGSRTKMQEPPSSC